MKDQRKCFRNPLSFFSLVTDRDSGNVLGYLENLSMEGALMIGNTFIRLGSILALRCDLPKTFYNQKQLDLLSKVIWIKPDVEPGLYRIGLRLIKIKSSDLKVLEHIIKDYA